MSAPTRWDDLRPRIVTGVLIAILGLGGVAVGGAVFAAIVAALTGLVIWEMARMVAPERSLEAVALALITAAILFIARGADLVSIIAGVLAAALLGAALLRKRAPIYIAFAICVPVAGLGLIFFREVEGAVWVLWLVLTVVVTDVAGYFGGRAIGGPKFWPAVSPKKTWAGIVSGWVAAFGLALIFQWTTNAGAALLALAVAVSFASQMGDIAESALKRHVGVKDSSQLLPGHGGVFDRFDALLGASLFMIGFGLLVDLPDLSP